MRRYITILMIGLLSTVVAQGQIMIGGNVYGGGNVGNVDGSTKVTVRSGDLKNVFGGARMANVGGNSYVNIDGENASGYMVINYVYGGNDISGQIGTAAAVGETLPTELNNVIPEPTAAELTTSGKTRDQWRASYKESHPYKDDVDNTWNSYVHLSTKMDISNPDKAALDNRKVYIGQLFAGGNGAYKYIKTGKTITTGTGSEAVTKHEYEVYLSPMKTGDQPIATIATEEDKYLPEVEKAYLDVQGGSIVYAYGGGNNATVKEKTVIHVDNPSEVVNHILVNEETRLEANAATYSTYTTNNEVPDGYIELLNTSRFKDDMGINIYSSRPESDAYQIGRFFGGNNLAEMSIRPTWNLQGGKIRNLYSGGNKGSMTCSTGLLLEIKPEAGHITPLVVDNAYGGCRMADVRPLLSGTLKSNPLHPAYTSDIYLEGYHFPKGLPARVLVYGGEIHNVYGGNDVTGKVWGGNAVGIYSSISGDVYGGGNGSYPYTDNWDLKDDELYGDFYYGDRDGSTNGFNNQDASVAALNAYRPNAEQVSIRLAGSSSGQGRPNYTIIGGSVYLGGNSATLANTKSDTTPMVELKMGSYVIADSVFLGNNGENMVLDDILEHYAGCVDNDGKVQKDNNGDVITTEVTGTKDFSSLDLTDKAIFAKYMDGVVMSLQPSLVFDDEKREPVHDPATYENYTSYVGSFYCGGNVGSMAIPDINTYRVDKGLNIYEKFVAGCNNADIPAGHYNAAYEGGVLGHRDTDPTKDETNFTDASGNIKDRIQVDLQNLTITPLRWKNEDDKSQGLIWNTNKWGDIFTAVENGVTLTSGNKYYTSNRGAGEFTSDGTEVANGTNYFVKEAEQGFYKVPSDPSDKNIRLLGGNVYGGCYNSGHVNGNVIININDTVLKKKEVFETGIYGNPASGVKFEDQRDDVMALAMAVFGAGYGEETEIWGSTTVNLNKGYAFQIFGGGEMGVVGKHKVDGTGEPVLDDEGNFTYEFDPRYSATVNLNGTVAATSNDDDVPNLAETEYIYGGGNEGDVCGNTLVNLGYGRIYDAFGGASDADILGHAEVYIGRQPDGTDYKDGFPWIRDIVYGGNDLGGTIHAGIGDDGKPVGYEEGYDFKARIRDWANDKGKIHLSALEIKNNKDIDTDVPDVLKSSTYVEYLQGRVDTIFGGGYGYYNYNDKTLYGPDAKMPVQQSSFVNIRPKSNSSNALLGAFGGGTGFPGVRADDAAQDRSYVLVDIPYTTTNFNTTEIFGSGSYNGLGMGFNTTATFADSFDPDQLSAIIDLWRGQIGNVFGGSYNEGITARTVVNVPEGSSITMYTTEPDYEDEKRTIKTEKKYGNIFGGAYGTQILPPCDVFESNVNYRSALATVKGSIFGGNNSERRTLYSKVNIYTPVYSDHLNNYTAAVYGAGQGIDTWSEYTEVNLWPGAEVYEVYGGGMMGHVLNAESVQTYMQLYKDKPSAQISAQDPNWSKAERWTGDVGTSAIKNEWKTQWADEWADAWTLGNYYSPDADSDGDGVTDSYDYKTYAGNTSTNLNNTAIVRRAEEVVIGQEIGQDGEGKDIIDTKTVNLLGDTGMKFNTNVIIHEGAKVSGYAYGGGYGKSGKGLSGDVYGLTYIALLGGTVTKDLYAAGTSGAVYDLFGSKAFTASTNAYVKGGTVRNVYGGGWEGNVGSHPGKAATSTTAADPNYTGNDILGETHVVIGDLDGASFTSGIPAIQRNAYGGGEGGAVFGTTNTTINNGYIGYVHLTANQKQDDKGNVVDAAPSEGLVERYEEKIIDETYKDSETKQFVPNRNLDDAGCVFGGGYVDNSSVDKTNVTIYSGHIRNSAFGGGEIAAVGRGAITESGSGDNVTRTLSALYRPGKTHIEMYGGHVYRNVFGGGRGYDNLGRYGKLHADGCVFGQTEVHIHGGEIGSTARLDFGDGNVFGGGDIGYVYSAFEETDKEGNPVFYKGVKIGERYGSDAHQGYYFKHTWADDEDGGRFIMDGTENIFTEDCKVLIEPHCKVLKEYTLPKKDTDGNLIYVDGKLQTETYSVDNVSFMVKEASGDDPAEYEYFYPGDYVPIGYLNTMKNKSSDADRWNCLDPTGIIIHNAVFGGGNTPSGKSVTNANIPSVFGNATASIHDVYHRDLITLGTRHQGGLYGDGNLTLVDGYRELNITNYGTDYYSIEKEISIEDYRALPDREADYYELKFTCISDCEDKEGTQYKAAVKENGVVKSKASTITYDELLTLFLTEKKDAGGHIVYVEGTQTPVMESWKYNGIDVLTLNANNEWMPTINPSTNKPYYWEESGVLPVYAGRLMNSLQRADFCGVWGSRMVMQGARDRVPDEVDLTNYTINRVREVSLNKKTSTAGDNVEHGNYFGIYNIVNYLGALTSDVDFGGEEEPDHGAIRVTDNQDKDTYGADYDPANTTIGFDQSVKYKKDIIAQASKIDNVTIQYSDSTIHTTDIAALYKLRSIKGLTFSGTRLNQTYYDWKALHHDERKRNNGNSHNKVALASGVYLEITTEKSTGHDLYEKDWGPITGVIELDLINVSSGIGGGFVYAKNVHGVRNKTDHKNTTLTALNKDAVTQWDYEYKDPEKDSESDQREWETSGNFVHSTQTIIDDCYNISNRYYGTSRVPAHYWYIKGSVYVYDQYISAYTGSPNAFSEAVDIPLTITAASHGTMKLLNVQPNRYAYYSQPGVKMKDDGKIVINDKTYNLNDPISYWDWYLLPASERALFIENTYVNCVAVNIDNEKENGEPKIYAPGTYVMTESEFNNFGTHTYKNAEGEIIKDANDHNATTAYIFRQSNNLGHDTGYILTYQVNNPAQWDTWYTLKNGNYQDKITLKQYNALNATTDKTSDPVILGKDAYHDGPTYRIDPSKLAVDEEGVVAAGVVLGQSKYEVGSLIPKSVQDNYPYTDDTKPEGQATFMKAYMITQDVTIKEGTDDRHLNAGATISEEQKTKNSTILNASNCDEAYICTKTIQVSEDNVIYRETKMAKGEMETKYITPLYTKIKNVNTALSGLTNAQLDNIKTIDDFDTYLTSLSEAEKSTVKTALKPLLALKNEYTDYLVPAYYCTDAGKYGGSYYEAGVNYRGLEAWSSMSEEDREMFLYNYDALDVLIDPLYGKNAAGSVIYPEGQKYEYDGNYTTSSQVKNETTGNKAKYSLEQALDYTATYIGGESLTYTTDNGTSNTVTGTTKPELTRTEFERLPNEQRHYVAIYVKDGQEVKNAGGTVTGYKVYVVNHGFQVGNTPYAVGTILTDETYQGLSDHSNITELTFPASEKDNTYYYCRESYAVGYNGSGVDVTNQPTSVVTGTAGYDEDGNSVAIKSGTYTTNDEVPIGLVINATDYDKLQTNNKQKNFSFHGISPTETSTLFVSKESNIYDLSKDKIITVIYEYNYDESDASGNVTPVTERHVLNIHITFESGVPVVEDITKPDLILPGDFITLGEPNVKPGAYEVTGGGWELFETKRDAESHVNGKDFKPTFDPLYWYQHDWYVAYYAKSYLGRTYSNAVPVSVANYHDLADVMSDANKEHHMYIDHEGVKRDPKIYIKDYSADNKNGLDLLKDLFDLSLETKTYDNEGKPVPVASGKKLAGHVPLESHVKGGADLEFFLRADVDHTGSWTSIGTNAQCFEGTLHGEGHTISGLDNSLFGYLCGNVYNLGVTGSFTGAGVADEGEGYVENCWVNTSAPIADVANVRAVFGNPTAGSGVKQIVNSYYQNTKVYDSNTDVAGGYITTDTDNHGLATPMPDKAFYNGEVAYDLNGFYLYKRYNDKMTHSGGDNQKYSYLTLGDDHTLKLQKDHYYADNLTDNNSSMLLCSSGYNGIKYVEDRYANEDFLYAGGTIPTSQNVRYYTETVKDEQGKDVERSGYAALWPDDYLFFGQMLTYGYDALRPYVEHPEHLVKDDTGCLLTTEETNRVYRAPAYYRSKTMDMAHFNPNAYLAQREKLTDEQIAAHKTPHEAYPNMTAIDFAGHNKANELNGTYGLGLTAAGAGIPQAFYPPLLDDDGLLSIKNCDETQNLVVYAPLATAANASEYANLETYGVLNGYFVEPKYSDYYQYPNGYRLVTEAPVLDIHGHLVQGDVTEKDDKQLFVSTIDHLLVDKQDFNAPIAYTFDSSHRMWYQRKPEDIRNYVDIEWIDDDGEASTPLVRTTKGWEDVSLPFTAELVTTHQKGEITHFYEGSKTGHEYWLREYKGIVSGSTREGVVTGDFKYPDQGSTTKKVTNDFLWDYYYYETTSPHQKDANDDDYLKYKTYYRDMRTYQGYPLMAGAKAYIIGLPGVRYYEFDLSGNFEAKTTKDSQPSKLRPQIITFASNTGAIIAVSDDEAVTDVNGYQFKQNYMNRSIAAGSDIYTLNAGGSAYDKVPAKEGAGQTPVADTPIYAFRPYFTSAPNTTRTIIFGNDETEEMKGAEDEHGDPLDGETGTLRIWAKKNKIYVESSLSFTEDVRVVTPAGITVASFAVKPGKTVEVKADFSGMYIVHTLDGKYTKKVTVKRK